MYCILILMRNVIYKYIFLCFGEDPRRISKKLIREVIFGVAVGKTEVGGEKWEYLNCILFMYYLIFDSEHVTIFYFFKMKTYAIKNLISVDVSEASLLTGFILGTLLLNWDH